MNFLELCKRVCSESGVSGGANLVSAVTNQQGLAAKVVSWVQTAYDEIQSDDRGWVWMLGTKTFSTVIGQDVYMFSAIALTDFREIENVSDQFGNARPNMFYTRVDGTRRWVYPITRGEWQLQYGISTSTDQGDPCHVLVGLDRFTFRPFPKEAGSVTFSYFKTPSTLTNSTDTPAMAADLHMIIVFKALKELALAEGDQTLMARAERGYSSYLRKMMDRYMTPIDFEILPVA